MYHMHEYLTERYSHEILNIRDFSDFVALTLLNFDMCGGYFQLQKRYNRQYNQV